MDGGSKEFDALIALQSDRDAPADVYGARANALIALQRAGLPVPPSWAVSAQSLRTIYHNDQFDALDLAGIFAQQPLVSVRASTPDRNWGGPRAVLNIGLNDAQHELLGNHLGKDAADRLYFLHIKNFATSVARMDGDEFEAIAEQNSGDFASAILQAKALYSAEIQQPFSQDGVEQLKQAMRSLASAWHGTSARILREARGAPADAGLGLVIQAMALTLKPGESGTGFAQFVLPLSGEPTPHGRYLNQTSGFDLNAAGADAKYLGKDKRGKSLQDLAPQQFDKLRHYAKVMYREIKDEVQLDFALQDGELHILDYRLAERSGRAQLEILARLVDDGLLDPKQAVARINARQLNEVLHAQIDPKAERNKMGDGIGASPGAASGKIVFSANQAVAYEARGEDSILVRVETTPDDIRGIHSANGILTQRGGINSHAAVVARTMGVPCVVGAQGLTVDPIQKTLTLPDGTQLSQGEEITIDGTNGDVFWNAIKLVEPSLGKSFNQMMDWCDDLRQIGVRGNADTPDDVRLAQAFGVDGIGLVRTEHMFFEPERLTVMRELIFAQNDQTRQESLDVLLPMQRGDFVEIFNLMQTRPVCIRLLDPPLHEFLPRSKRQIKMLADAMGLSAPKIEARIEALSEFNPMLGMRGVRLGVTVPEIYEMQARAIFEAVCELQTKQDITVVPEIMIPLVSARKEVELIHRRIDALASEVRSQFNVKFSYKIGVMVETPRAVLRAGDISRDIAFMSIGTNDLTQMTYGLSRDDAGRFMAQYVKEGVFHEDPFLSLDVEGVGELLIEARKRGRAENSNLVMGVCGEHGGDPESIKFCVREGYDYVSCSPFRAPIAKLAAAQAALE